MLQKCNSFEIFLGFLGFALKREAIAGFIAVSERALWGQFLDLYFN